MQNWFLHRLNYQEMPLYPTGFVALKEDVDPTLVEKGTDCFVNIPKIMLDKSIHSLVLGKT